ncbi:hypothetical protein Tsubulata_029972 [Turnera subulata]|uniref:Gem-associated protein 2 n=1 Tax=Turnera subulata TaxID=218843 RepID=A0A9Q0FXF4_9ROSI|nr:hypothetical protein Tsubulata_029972 [Turnera subulata]
MADDESVGGSKRRIQEIEETLLLQPPQPQEQHHPCIPSSSVSTPKEESKDSSFFVSSPKDGQELVRDYPSPTSSFKKVRCSPEPRCTTEENLEVKGNGVSGSSLGEERRVDLSDSVSGSIVCGGKDEGFGGNMESSSGLPVEKAGDFVVGCGSGGGLKQGRIVEDVDGVKEVKMEVEVEAEEGCVRGVAGSDGTDGLDTKEASVDMDVDGLLESKKKQLLAAIEVGSIFREKACVEDADGAAILGSLKGIDDSVRSSLKIELIDDTALIEPLRVPRAGNAGANVQQRNGKKNQRQETDGKKAKHPQRKGKSARKGLELCEGPKKATQVDESRSVIAQVGGAQNGGGRNGDRVQRKYSREEMQALRFVNIVEQRKMWRDIYTGLGNAVVKEYDGLGITKHQGNTRSNFDPSRRFGRMEGGRGIIREISSENEDNESENMDEDQVENVNVVDASHSIRNEDACTFLEEEWSEEDDSDEEYTSIQRPAFAVEGEPDFDSGPPEDGLEYLRRVRWEAAHIPKVKVAKIDRSKIVKEQSVYMPQIPDIAKCPENLLPSKQWEDEFLADFSQLRLLLSHNEAPSTILPQKLPSLTIAQEQNPFSTALTDSIVVEKFNSLVIDGAQPVVSDGSGLGNTTDSASIENEDDQISLSTQNPTCKSSANDSPPNYPTLTAILAMDSVARVSKLKERIRVAETRSTLSRSECLWLFALCAAVDTPLHADSCAALRSLLRKCASLRAAKSEVDDEVIMLNILATISGRFFGQSGN